MPCASTRAPAMFTPRPLSLIHIFGLVDCIVLNRTKGRVSEARTGKKAKVKTHKKRTSDDKESRRWLQATQMAGDCLSDADMITMVGDREGDIYDLFANRPANVHLLVRSAQPRTVATGGLLPDFCAALPEQARETIDVPAKGKQPARKATVAIRLSLIHILNARFVFTGWRRTATRPFGSTTFFPIRRSVPTRCW